MENKVVLYEDGIGFPIMEESAPVKIWNKAAEMCKQLLTHLPEDSGHVVETEILIAAKDLISFENCTCYLIAYACTEDEDLEQEDYEVIPGTELYAAVKAYVMETLGAKLFPI